MKHGSLFHGSGGLALGLEQAGFTTAWFKDILYGDDITDADQDPKDRVDLISGGPPCQRVSAAATFQKSRSGATLWPDMLRIVANLRPNWVVVEQPKGGRSVIIQASQDLQRLGYGCAGRVVNSEHWVPQRRLRWFIVARLGISGLALWNKLYSDSKRVERRKSDNRSSASSGTSALASLRYFGSCPDCLRGGVFAGISARKSALMGAGNAVTVPVARWLGEKIIQAEESIIEQT